MTHRRRGPEALDASEVVTVGRQLPPGEQTFDIERAVNALRQCIAKAEAFATTADDLFEEVRSDRRRLERLAWIVSEGAIAAQAALAAVNKLAEAVVKHGVGTWSEVSSGTRHA